MAVREHYCDHHPDGAGWYPDATDSCPYHGTRHSGKAQLGYREGKKARAKADRQKGVIGVDRGPFISAKEGA